MAPAQLGNRRAGLGLLQDVQDLVLAESGLLHVDLLVTHYEKIPLPAATLFRGDYLDEPFPQVSVIIGSLLAPPKTPSRLFARVLLFATHAKCALKNLTQASAASGAAK